MQRRRLRKFPALKTLISLLTQRTLKYKVSPPKSKKSKSLSTEIYGDLNSQFRRRRDLRPVENKDGGK